MGYRTFSMTLGSKDHSHHSGNTLLHNGLNSCSARKVRLLRKAHVQAHLNFANEHLDDSESDWEKVLWSDETQIELNS
ncbi:hypothetical protein NFI96_030377, partial [Prochilodus magdalenae]